MILAALAALALVACDGDDPELSTESTIVTGPTGTGATGTQPPGEGTTTTRPGGGDGGAATTLVGQAVTSYEVVREVPNDNGVAQHIVIPNGAYTDVDLENFVVDLIEANPDLYGAQIFDDPAAAQAFRVPRDQRTEEETAALDRHWFVTLEGRDRIVYRGPFSEFPGGAIGS